LVDDASAAEEEAAAAATVVVVAAKKKEVEREREKNQREFRSAFSFALLFSNVPRRRRSPLSIFQFTPRVRQLLNGPWRPHIEKRLEKKINSSPGSARQMSGEEEEERRAAAALTPRAAAAAGVTFALLDAARALAAAAGRWAVDMRVETSMVALVDWDGGGVEWRGRGREGRQLKKRGERERELESL